MEDLTPRDFAAKFVREMDRKYPHWKEKQDTVISAIELAVKSTIALCEMQADDCDCEACNGPYSHEDFID